MNTIKYINNDSEKSISSCQLLGVMLLLIHVDACSFIPRQLKID